MEIMAGPLHVPGMMRLALLLLLTLAAACSGWSYTLDVGPSLRTGFVGDTIQFTATENSFDPAGVPASVSSTAYPELFTWQSSNPAVADFPEKARLALKAPGEAQITIMSPHDGRVVLVTVKPRP